VSGFDPTPAPDAELGHRRHSRPPKVEGRVSPITGPRSQPNDRPGGLATSARFVAKNERGFFKSTLRWPRMFGGRWDTGLSVQNGVHRVASNGDRLLRPLFDAERVPSLNL